jgi:hypothetical protein
MQVGDGDGSILVAGNLLEQVELHDPAGPHSLTTTTKDHPSYTTSADLTRPGGLPDLPSE